jgi:hypothetical protein
VKAFAAKAAPVALALAIATTGVLGANATPESTARSGARKSASLTDPDEFESQRAARASARVVSVRPTPSPTMGAPEPRPMPRPVVDAPAARHTPSPIADAPAARPTRGRGRGRQALKDEAVDAAAPTPTDMPQPPAPGTAEPPTSTPVPPTDTPVAVPTPTVTPTPSATTLDIPACAHDVTKWHPLVELNADGTIRCTYGHEHGSNPHALDTMFGSLTTSVGQEIAFPWTTSSAENSDTPLTLATADNRPWAGGKHRFFKWETITSADLAAAGINGCPPNPNATYGFDNVRMEVHADSVISATVRFHSFYAEARACSTTNPNYHGIIRIGGHFDYGKLFGLENTPTGQQDVRIPLPGIDPPDTPYTNVRRTHGTSAGSCSGCTGAVRGDFTWYGANATPFFATGGPSLGVSDGIREGDWGPVDPNNPGGPVQFYGPPGDPNHDHGWAAPLDIFAADIPPASALPGAVTHADGTYSWSGDLDVHGNVVAPCTTPSTSCIPASLTNVLPGSHQFANDVTKLPIRNFDVIVNNQTLIQFPN